MIELDEVEYEVSKSVEQSLIEIREELKEINKMLIEMQEDKPKLSRYRRLRSIS